MTTITKTNPSWAGYVLTPKAGSVSYVSASWIQPAFHGTCGGSNNLSEAGFWVGIDGYNDKTVEQVGTVIECKVVSGSSAIFYIGVTEFYPAPSTVVTSTAISPGDHITASASYASSTGAYTLILRDITSRGAWSTTDNRITAQRSSAEWITESPCKTGCKSYLPMVNFGSVTFTGCSATLSGHNHAIGVYKNIRLNMINAKGTAYKATTGSLQSSGTQFRVAWKSYGP
ncbi:MAG: G1 family endopeptidase [Thermoplasmata archaeon]|nr:G1 family endopeptidase [Thermoplasmata archaeon]